jgi:menaquinone-dependent protoporphyrinogen oxidase
MRALVAYATKQGHTALIARRVGDVLADAGHTVEVCDVSDLPIGVSLDDYDAIVLGAPIHVGKHLSRMTAFVRRHREDLQRRPGAFFSSSLTSADQSEDAQRTARELVETFVEKTGWRPDHLGLFAGALPYRKYNFLLRALMKGIARRTGRDTDTSRDHEYTRWEEVDAFAHEVARTLSERAATRATAPRV